MSLSPITLLFVDDDPLMLLLYRPHLERAGYHVVSAATGEEAIKMATSEHPQIIVTDIRLPGLDGLSTLRELRKLETAKLTPAIVITSLTTYEICRDEVKKLGAAAFLPKPFSPAQLLGEIKHALAETAS